MISFTVISKKMMARGRDFCREVSRMARAEAPRPAMWRTPSWMVPTP